MNTTMKKLIVLGLAEVVGRHIASESREPETIKLGYKVAKEAEKEILGLKVKITSRKHHRVGDVIADVYKEKEVVDTLEILSLALAGVQDFAYHSNNNTYNNLEKAIINIINKFDPDGEREQIYENATQKYQNWLTIKGEA